MKVYNVDCLVGMKEIEDSSIDHIICDLPYFQVLKNDWDNAWKSGQEYLGWINQVILEYKRIIKPNGNIILFVGRQYSHKICSMLDLHFTEKRVIIWSRKRNLNNSRGKALSSGYELILYYCNGVNGTFNNIKIKRESNRKEYTTGILKDGVSLSDVWDDIPALPHNSKEKLKHPSQKPIRLIQRIVDLFTNENDIILDNCAGTGTTGIACLNGNRKFILMESNKEYCDIINDRITGTV